MLHRSQSTDLPRTPDDGTLNSLGGDREEVGEHSRGLLPWALPTLALYGVLGFVVQKLLLFSTVPILTPLTWKGALGGAALLLCASLFSPAIRRRVFPIPDFSPLAAWGLLVVLATDFATRRFGFASDPYLFWDVLILGLLGVWVWRRGASISPLALLFSVQTILTVVFLRYTEGKLIFSDDHPSFLYRLLLLREHFPSFPFYNTDWNLGYSAREFLPTGALSIFLASLPILSFFHAFAPLSLGYEYSAVLVSLFLWLVPWANYKAARLFGLSPRDALVVALIALGPSLGFFEWLLSFGTLGFLLSTGLLPLTFVILYRAACGESSWSETLLGGGAMIGCLAWPLMGIAFVPLAIIALLRPRTLFAPHRRKRLLFFAIVFATFFFGVVVPYFQHFNVAQFVSGSTLPGVHSVQVQGESGVAKITASVKKLRDGLSSFNPILLLFSLPGILLVRKQPIGRAAIVTIIWLFSLAVVGPVIKPQLELHRMVLPVGYLLGVLSAVAIGWILNQYQKRFLSSAVILGAIILTPLSVGGAYLNRSEHRYILAPEVVSDIAQAIGEFGGTGRTFILGFILQDFGASDFNAQNGGHVALLPLLSGKEMFASEFYHSKWTTVDPIPLLYRAKGADGIEEFLDLVNATAVVTFRREWVDYCQRDPRYRQVAHSGRFRVFTRETKVDFFLEGRGEVRRASRDVLEVRAETPIVVLKYRFLPALHSSIAGVGISPHYVFDEELGEGKTKPVHFIRLEVPEELRKRGEWIRLSFK